MRPRLSLLLSILVLVILAVGCARFVPDRLTRRAQPVFVPTPSAPLVLEQPTADPVAAAPENEVADALTVEPTSTSEPAVAEAVAQEPTAVIVEATPAPTATPVYQPVAASVALSGFRHEWQTWNNCGPATMSMNLSYFGSTLDQAKVADVLRPNRDDKNVSPDELVQYARGQGYHATMQVNGTPDLLRLLLSNGIPVIIETWHIPEPNDGMGHYRLLTGYDEASQRWIAHDAYDREHPVNPDPNGTYQGIYLPYAETGELWDVFNRVFVVVYTDAQAPIVESILGERVDETVMWQQAMLQAQLETQTQPENAFAWFNLGTDLVALGQYEQAAAAYDRARQLGLPWRMLWYQFGPFEAYYEIGRYDEVITLADATLQTVTHVEELHYWKGRALLAQGNVDASRRLFQKALELNRNYLAASDALAALPS